VDKDHRDICAPLTYTVRSKSIAGANVDVEDYITVKEDRNKLSAYVENLQTDFTLQVNVTASI
jgi:hypothetical protein